MNKGKRINVKMIKNIKELVIGKGFSLEDSNSTCIASKGDFRFFWNWELGNGQFYLIGVGIPTIHFDFNDFESAEDFMLFLFQSEKELLKPLTPEQIYLLKRIKSIY